MKRKRLILMLGLILFVLSPIMVQMPYGQLDWRVQAQPYATATPQPAATAAPVPGPAPGCSGPSR